MRIPLAEPKKKPQARLRRHSVRGHRKRFDQAVAVRTQVSRGRAPVGTTVPARRRRLEAPAERTNPLPSPASSLWRPFRELLIARWWALLLLFVLLGLTAYAGSNERFFVYAAEVVGVRRLDGDAIYQAAGIDKQSIFWIDPQTVAENVARVQGVQAVTVRCAMPSSVTIRVEERQPVILWRSDSQKRDFWLDAEGVVLPYHGDASAAGAVFVVDYSGRPIDVGSRVEPAGLAASVIEMAASLSGVRVFYYSAERGLHFTQQAPTGEWPVYVGDSADLARKIQVTELLNRHFEDQRIRPAYVDVRWATRPVYGLPAGESSPGGN